MEFYLFNFLKINKTKNNQNNFKKKAQIKKNQKFKKKKIKKSNKKIMNQTTKTLYHFLDNC